MFAYIKDYQLYALSDSWEEIKKWERDIPGGIIFEQTPNDEALKEKINVQN